VVKLGPGGKVSIRNQSGQTHVIADVSGYFSATGKLFSPRSPLRVYDTRDGDLPLTGGEVRNLWTPLLDDGLMPQSTSALVLNVTVTGATASSDLRLWPTGEPVPNVSNLNFVAGQTVANLVVVKMADFNISIRNQVGETDVIIDVVGYFADVGNGFHPLNPSRILDSRSGTGLFGAWGAGQTRDLQVTGMGGVPAGATAVVMNVTVTGATASSDLRLWPTGEPVPNVSNLNFVAGQTVPNLVVVKLGPGGKVSIRNQSGQTHVIADVVGYYR